MSTPTDQTVTPTDQTATPTDQTATPVMNPAADNTFQTILKRFDNINNNLKQELSYDFHVYENAPFNVNATETFIADDARAIVETRTNNCFIAFGSIGGAFLVFGLLYYMYKKNQISKMLQKAAEKMLEEGGIAENTININNSTSKWIIFFGVLFFIFLGISAACKENANKYISDLEEYSNILQTYPAAYFST